VVLFCTLRIARSLFGVRLQDSTYGTVELWDTRHLRIHGEPGAVIYVIFLFFSYTTNDLDALALVSVAQLE
jgi:hypothetical protein